MTSDQFQFLEHDHSHGNGGLGIIVGSWFATSIAGTWAMREVIEDAMTRLRALDSD